MQGTGWAWKISISHSQMKLHFLTIGTYIAQLLKKICTILSYFVTIKNIDDI